MDLQVRLSDGTISTSIHDTVTSSSALKPQYPVSKGHINICHNNNNQCLNSNAVDCYGDRSKSHPKDLHKEKSKETGPTDEQKPKTTAELQNGQTTESKIRQPAESDPGLMTENEAFADPVPLFNGKRTSKNVVVQTKIQGFFSEIARIKDYGRQEKIKWTHFLVMFVGQLYSDKLLLKCFYKGHCKGTLKWTGGKSGTTLFNVETQRTEKVRFIEGKGEKWFGMQIQNWNHEDIEAHYKCWFGFSKLIVNIVNRAGMNNVFSNG
ncbi:Hypothetical predicted protein [Mytilus galloprovincialis]|nr:Hypothetical predicted protein [Mytilus galloprovincialis]